MKNTIILFLLFCSSVFAGNDSSYVADTKNSPWMVTPKARLDYKENGDKPIWVKFGEINILFSPKEDINKLKKEFKKSYKIYLNTDPDVVEEDQWSFTMKESKIDNEVQQFELLCRTYIDAPLEVTGTISYNTVKKIPTSEICKMSIILFLVNGYRFEKSKKDRTVILRKF
jgi:hypothetical protein